MKEHILKLSSKIAVLFNDGVISQSDMKEISQSLRDIYRYLVKSMYRPPPIISSLSSSSSDHDHLPPPPPVSSSPSKTLSSYIQLTPEEETHRQQEIIQYIIQLLNEFHQFLLPIISINMSPQNSSRLTLLIEFFQAQNGLFFQVFLFSDEYREEKNQFKSYAKYLPSSNK